MPALKIIKPGMETTIQDLGRYGFQQFGISVAGAMDTDALQLANLLVANPVHFPVLETSIIGPHLVFLDNCVFAVTGAIASLRINDAIVTMNKTLQAEAGDYLSFSPVSHGCRSYLAVQGALRAEKTLNSYATDLNAGFGGCHGRRLQAGDEIVFESRPTPNFTPRRLPINLVPVYGTHAKIRVLPGPEFPQFSEAAKADFFKACYTITPQSNRMGYRLNGPAIPPITTTDIISSPINLGTIQIPGNGQPIIMMADRQTTGGYTRIANVISVDIPVLAQLKPGDTVQFEETDMETAQQLFNNRRAQMDLLDLIFK